MFRPGLTVEPIVLRGRPATEIVDQARRMQADLVVVGQPRPRQDRVDAPGLGFRGSRGPCSRAGARCARPANQADRARRGTARRAPTQRRRCAAGDLADLRAALRSGSSASLTSAIPWWTGFPEAGSPETMPMYIEAAEASRKEHGELAREMAAQLQSAGFTAEADLRDGDAATEILAAATAAKADLIIMGTHGRTGAEAAHPRQRRPQRSPARSMLRARRPGGCLTGYPDARLGRPGWARDQRNGAAATSRSAGRTTITARIANVSRIRTRTSSISSGNHRRGARVRRLDRTRPPDAAARRARRSLVALAFSQVNRAGRTADRSRWICARARGAHLGR